MVCTVMYSHFIHPHYPAVANMPIFAIALFFLLALILYCTAQELILPKNCKLPLLASLFFQKDRARDMRLNMCVIGRKKRV